MPGPPNFVMKTISAIFTGTLFAAAMVCAQPSTKLAAEWFAPHHSQPEKFSLIDEATGTVRIASLDAAGHLTWATPIPTGIPDVTDVTTGVTGSSGEILALTSPSANRVGLLDIASAAPYLRVLPSLSGIGPGGLTTMGSGASRELLIASSLNGVTPGKLESFNNLSTSGNLLASVDQNRRFRRLQPLTKPGSSTALALFSETLGVNTRMGMISRSGGNLTISPRITFTLETEFATDIRSGYQPTKTFVIGYRAGLSISNLMEIASPLNTLSDIVTTSPAFPFIVTTILPVVGGGAGPISDGFIAIAADGTQARWLRINSAGNGYEATGPQHTFTPASGTFLSGVIPMPGIGVVSLQSATPGGSSTSYVARAWNGSSWIETDSGSIPGIPDRTSAPATLLFYSENPATDEAARLLGIRHLGAWTRRLTLPDPMPASVFSEQFVSSTGGLTVSTQASVNPPALASYVITNQVEPAVSISSLGSSAALFTPDLRIDPASGNYDHSFQVTALFDDAGQELLYQQGSGSWLTWENSLPVVWSTDLRFMLRSRANGSRGPIESRQYTLSPAALATQDSDNDGVPDYVEAYFNLNPFGGPDSDGDGVSDLDEILKGTHPGLPTEVPNTIFGISSGNGGVCIVASALTSGNKEIALGEEMKAHASDGSLLARAPVTTLPAALPDGATRGAILRSASTFPAGDLVSLRTATYFYINVGPTRVLAGSEMIAFVPAEPAPVFAPAYSPVGTNLIADAQGWIAAAIAAAPSHPLANALSIVAPAESATSVLLEQLTHLALSAVRPAADPASALDAFTLFAARDFDQARISLTAADRAMLLTAGFTFQKALDLAATAKAAMTPAAKSVYARHISASSGTPGMMLPIDALRILLRGGPAPVGYAGAVSTANLNAATAAYNAVLANAAQSYRPIETWTLAILENPPSRGVYQKLGDNIPVVLLTPSGERFFLDRGLGLRPGTQFQISGFTDTPPDGSYPTLEITGAMLTFEPAATDHDADGNLLDDEWEKYFFGATGQDPFSQPNGNGYSLLQYFLDGADPRGSASPAGPAVSLGPQSPLITRIQSGGYNLDFLFPGAYQNRFRFVLESSTTLAPGSFDIVPDTTIQSLGGDELRALIPPSATPPGRCFYRIRVMLK